MPELRQWLPQFPEAPQVDPLRARFLSFDAMARFIESVSERQPLALLFDDLQRADAATLRLTAFLVQQLQRARVLIAATLRSGAATDELRAELLAEIAGHASARPIDLTGLSRAELARYVEVRAGAAAPEPVIAPRIAPVSSVTLAAMRRGTVATEELPYLRCMSILLVPASSPIRRDDRRFPRCR